MSKTLEELGYEKHETGERIFYVTSDKEIKFNKWLKCICAVDSNNKWQYITMEELKAIYKYCEDNKWI